MPVTSSPCLVFENAKLTPSANHFQKFLRAGLHENAGRYLMKPQRIASVALMGDSGFTATEDVMSRELLAHNKPVFDQLHPRIYGAAVGLIAWFALMAWVLFDRSSDVSLSLMFMSVLFVVAIALPWALSRIWRRFQMPYELHPQPTSFHDWVDGDLAVWGARLHGRDAAIDVLLPLVAVSLGLTAIGIVFVIVRTFAT